LQNFPDTTRADSRCVKAVDGSAILSGIAIEAVGVSVQLRPEAAAPDR
jgi:hypothetical protein